VRVRSAGGFTLLEVLLAVVVLSVGVLALVGTAALTSRMIGRGAQAARVGLTAATRIERLQQAALATSPVCGGPDWRSDSAGGPTLTESWEVLDAAGTVRGVRIVLRSRHPGGSSNDTVSTAVLCYPP
jgi:prepilin-type N-terminal cleavage/methylation domain-containing protein